MGDTRRGADREVEDLVTVDYLVVEFPVGVSDFGSEMRAEVAALVDAELVRLLAMVVLHKHADGTFEACSVPDLEGVDIELGDPVAVVDIERLAADVDAGRTAGVLIWENTMGSPFASAARLGGCGVVAGGSLQRPGRDDLSRG